MERKYSPTVYRILRERAEANAEGIPTVEEIDALDRAEVMKRFLEWEGILGYTSILLNIAGLE
jgi:cell division protein FtsX